MHDPFPTTQWSELLALRSSGDDGARLAIAHLYERYWHPLYAYLRRRGRDPEWVEDTLQGFFARLMDRGFTERLNLSGKLRAFLLASLKNYVYDEFDREQALKRRPERPLLPLDIEDAESRYHDLPSDEMTPEQVYEQEWALSVIRAAAKRLAEQEHAAGRSADYVLLAPHVVGGAGGKNYQEIAELLSVSREAVKVRVHRLRGRLGELVRAEVECGIETGGNANAEIGRLMRCSSPHAVATSERVVRP